MKRLLAYLFIVLGFTISIQTKSYAPVIVVDDNRVALIIGIEKYKNIPKADFASSDAAYFYKYATTTLGVSKSNTKLLVDESASLVSSLRTLSKWLPSKIKSGETELFIFFSGHGFASYDGKKLYLLAHDSDPDLLDPTAISISQLYKKIFELKPKNVTMFMDTSFSGSSTIKPTVQVPNNFTIFSSSKLNQISSGLKEAKHGIFSYYLMKGLEGNADLNQDKKITNGELLAFMDENVSKKAAEIGRKQNPTLTGDPDKILIINNKKTQITKKETSQMQKVDEEFKIVKAKGKFKHLGDYTLNESCKLAKERAVKNAINQAYGQMISLKTIYIELVVRPWTIDCLLHTSLDRDRRKGVNIWNR